MASTHLNYGSFYGPHPGYGNGVYRRGIRLIGGPGSVVAEMEDTHHAMRVAITHDQSVVTGIVTETIRVPTTVCAAASGALDALVGTSIDTLPTALYRGGAARMHCTHLFDLCVLGIAHARRGEVARRYDVAVPDDTGAGTTAVVLRDGEVVHEWRLKDFVVQSPAAFSGQPLLKGFVPWISERLKGDPLEAAIILQMGFFVAQARRKNIALVHGASIAGNLDMYGRCFAYQPDQVGKAIHIDSTRDLSRTPEQVLAFADGAEPDESGLRPD